jgi:hypothetical protein
MDLSGLNTCKNVRNSRNPVRFAQTIALFCFPRVLSKSISRLKKSSYLQHGVAYTLEYDQKSINSRLIVSNFRGEYIINSQLLDL